MTADELKQALTEAGWRISPNTIRRDDVQWYAWLPSTNSGRAELANCTSNEKPPALCIEPHEFDHGSMVHRSVEFIIRGLWVKIASTGLICACTLCQWMSAWTRYRML